MLNLQADGSALYTPQAWWTQAREGLNVTTVLLNNRSYAILHYELNQVGAVAGGEAGPRDARPDRPGARPRLAGARLRRAGRTAPKRPTTWSASSASAYAEPGPMLIEAVL